MKLSIEILQPRLARWAVLGVLVLLCAPWFLPSNKLYHQLLAVMLWLPGLLALALPAVRRALRTPEFLLFAVLSMWCSGLLIPDTDLGENPRR